MPNNKYLGLQDILNQCEPLFGNKTTFDEAYPQVDEIQIEYTENHVNHGYGGRALLGPHYINNKSNVGDFLRCSNPRCCRGGLNIRQEIRNMIEGKITFYEGAGPCQGYEGSPKGRVKHKPCMNFFKYKIRMKFNNLP